MAIIQIEIIQHQGHYHAVDVIVKKDDQVQISTSIPNVSFTIGITNTDGYFSTINSNIVVNQTNSPVAIGVISLKGANVNYYKISEVNDTIPGIDAPPRIIRVV